MGKLNESEKNLLKVMAIVSNKMMQGYSYRPNWNSQDDGDGEDEERELLRDKETRKIIQDEQIRKLCNSISLMECDTELLESLGFLKYDEDHTEAGQRLLPLWYYEILHNGETKKYHMDTDTRMGCVHEFVTVNKIY